MSIYWTAHPADAHLFGWEEALILLYDELGDGTLHLLLERPGGGYVGLVVIAGTGKMLGAFQTWPDRPYALVAAVAAHEYHLKEVRDALSDGG